jgi:hypothetical protein
MDPLPTGNEHPDGSDLTGHPRARGSLSPFHLEGELGGVGLLVKAFENGADKAGALAPFVRAPVLPCSSPDTSNIHLR